jgi:DNA-binding GntR family transcriptional regulator
VTLTYRKTDLVYVQLKDRVMSGEFEFGERLIVNDLADAMGTSRQPVLEAIKRLQADGLVEVTPQVGSHIVVPSPDMIRDRFEVFARLEGLVTKFAAERHAAEQMDELEPTAGLVLDSFDGDRFDVRVYLAGNRRFHDAVHRLAASEEAAAAAHRFFDLADFLVASLHLVQKRSSVARSAAEHKAIVDAIRARDGELADELAMAHVRSFAEPIERSLRQAIAKLGDPSGTARATA